MEISSFISDIWLIVILCSVPMPVYLNPLLFINRQHFVSIFWSCWKQVCDYSDHRKTKKNVFLACEIIRMTPAKKYIMFRAISANLHVSKTTKQQVGGGSL